MVSYDFPNITVYRVSEGGETAIGVYLVILGNNAIHFIIVSDMFEYISLGGKSLNMT